MVFDFCHPYLVLLRTMSPSRPTILLGYVYTSSFQQSIFTARPKWIKHDSATRTVCIFFRNGTWHRDRRNEMAIERDKLLGSLLKENHCDLMDPSDHICRYIHNHSHTYIYIHILFMICIYIYVCIYFLFIYELGPNNVDAKVLMFDILCSQWHMLRVTLSRLLHS